MEQKIIIRNNNLLFQFSGHNNNLLVSLKLWKITRSNIIFKNVSRKKKLYSFSCCIFLSNNFHMTFLLSDNSGMVYTPIQPHVVFRYKLNLLRPERENYTNLKKVYSFEFSKESSVSCTKRNLTQT